ncbi:branched-chain amino acid aminotransferase [Cohaesibacter marisflavi]|uniref:Probable branched-chain-amino-acid aminotransferase n=1 Tax=Cohaesibacter marisflavi TaxID=655353 RepID=A0A1I5A003_9HYPH|nr:branched-chain amino acid aminotransferase [Cohaesibacter marisflavi]SFN55811.1 branched-chain amino acid aminotransferase [Cohaesibacter marisflavi]
MAEFSQTWTWYKGEWLEGNPAMMGPRAHAFWQGSTVFDGARYFEGVMPDLDRHCERINRSCETLLMKPTMKTGEIMELAAEGCQKFGGRAVYIRPTYWGLGSLASVINVDPDDIEFCLTLFDAEMPDPNNGTRVTTTKFRRPTLETMPTNAKASGLYINNARCLKEAMDKGFDNAIVCDMLGNVAELATANFFIVKDGIVKTSVPNGSFLNGITRQRTIQLLRDAGETVVECSLTLDDCREADEMFSTGNYSKVVPILAFDDRQYDHGPIAKKARELYWEFAFKK